MATKFGIINDDNVNNEVIWCDEYKFIMLSKDRPLLPEIRKNDQRIVGRDGTYDFSDKTIDDRTIEVEVTFISQNVGELRYIARRAAQWFFNKGERLKLVFSDEPDVYYDCRLANQISLEQVASFGSFTLQFRCFPFAIAIEEAKNVYELASPTTLYRPIAPDDDYTFTNLSSGDNVVVNNYGTAPVKPTFIVSNFDGSYFRIDMGDKFIKVDTSSLTSALRTYYIDCERYQVYYTNSGNKINMLGKTTGDFLELQPTPIRQYDYDTGGRRYYFKFNTSPSQVSGNISITVPAIGGAQTYVVPILSTDTIINIAQKVVDKINTTTNAKHKAQVVGDDAVIQAKEVVGTVQGSLGYSVGSTNITINPSKTVDTNLNDIEIIYVTTSLQKPNLEVNFQARFY
jgi:predicted phage tail component-like protein